VGDSRAYLINQEGVLQLTTDHNVANELYEQGRITKEELNDHEGQHELTQALGQLTREEVPRSIGELHDGDTLLLCTDGLTGVLGEEVLFEFIQSARPLSEVADTMLEKVLAAGAPDNVSFGLIRFQTEDEVIQARHFSSKGHRLPFDRKPYEKKCRRRPALLLMILVSILFLFFVL